MRKRDINGNTENRHRAQLWRAVRYMQSGTYTIDSVGTVMVDTADGGHIVFLDEDEPTLMENVSKNLKRRN